MKRLRTQLRTNVSIAVGCLCVAVGCSPLMHNQDRYEALEDSPLLEDRQWTRRPPDETVPRRGASGELFHSDSGNISHTVSRWQMDAPMLTGVDASGEYLRQPPVEVTMPLLERGRERYNIYCAVCHDRVGTGNGMVVQRGFPRPPSLHTEQLRSAPLGRIYGVISDGVRAMPAYASKLSPRDRWAVVMYVRALQRSQHTTLDTAPADIRDQFNSDS